MTTTIRRLEEETAIRSAHYAAALKHFASGTTMVGGHRRINVGNRRLILDTMPPMTHRRLGVICLALLGGPMADTTPVARPAQSERGPYARIAIMRARDGHSVEWEAGYIRHLAWHRQVKDTFGWYSYSVWASTEHQPWIVYATFGHTSAELASPVSPAEDEQDTLLNVLPHAQFLGNAIYEFLPGLSRGSGVPTPTLRAEYTTVEVTRTEAKSFEAALAAEQPSLRGETLWYRMIVGGDTPRYVRLRPRASLAVILDERGEQALPDKVNGMISKMTVETLNLRPDMLVNVTPADGLPPR